MACNGEYTMVITTCADKASAKQLANIIVQQRLAACAQLIPIESVYVWEGEVCSEDETILLIKTKTALFDKLSAAIIENHSYEVPEIIKLPITGGHPDYLSWIDETIGN